MPDQEDVNKIVSQILRMGIDQVYDLIDALSLFREDPEKFGQVTITLKGGQVYRISYTVEGRPRFYKDK